MRLSIRIELALIILFAIVSGSMLAGELPSAGRSKSGPTVAGEKVRPKIVGKPTKLTVLPARVSLDGPRAVQQLLVSGVYPDGSERDLTRFCQFELSSTVGRVDQAGLIIPRADGRATIQISVAGQTIEIPLTVSNSQAKAPVSFSREVMPILSTAGCADIRCHGSPTGKDGFRLSLWGSDADLDYRMLTHDMMNRRTNRLQPQRGLMMRKAMNVTPHVGGRRFQKGSRFARAVASWQSEGLLLDDPPGLSRLVVRPNTRVIRSPNRWQQIAVNAEFEDGRSVDVSRLAAFTSSDLAIASVSREGLVEFHTQGEVVILCRYLGQLETVRLAYIAPAHPQYRWPNPDQNNYVDTHVVAKLKLLHIAPSDLCTDSEFVRRVYIDMLGMLPPAEVASEFVTSKTPNKRTALVDELLQRREFAEYWSKKWMDVLRVSRDAIQWQGAKAFHDWLTDRVHKNESFATVVSQMLVSQGDSFKNPAANFYCVPQIPTGNKDPAYLQKDLAEATAQLFLGVRLQCAKCHNHPYERWTQEDYLGLAAHFAKISRKRLGKAGPSGRAERRELSIWLDEKNPEVKDDQTDEAVSPQLFGLVSQKINTQGDRRIELAKWLTSPSNPYFAKAVVNRMWFHLHGRGIVDPVDDFRDSNPSANDALLEALAQRFVESGFRLKPIIRDIMTSRTYQLSSLPTPSNAQDDRYFSHMVARPVPAEVLFDAICHVTDVPEEFKITKDYTIGVPDGFVDLPKGTRAVQLPVNDIVTLINSSSKYVRYESHPFLRSFGQPTRTQTCECDREQKFGRKQALELVIGEMVAGRLSHKNNLLTQLLVQEIPDKTRLETLYWRALSRKPSLKASTALLKYIRSSKDKRQAWEDVLWTIINSQEFAFQH